MPLNTQIKRKGRIVPVRWGSFHVAAMVCAAAWDSGEGPFKTNTPPDEIDYPTDPCPITPKDSWNLVSYPIISMTPLNSGSYVLKGLHHFVDVTDGEILRLLPGDELIVWRD